VVGLIGGIGAGKSLVASLLAQKGARVLDADAVGHVLLDQTPARDEVLARFGNEVLARDRSGLPVEPPAIDRAILATVVFSEPASLKALEAILHPKMRQTFEKAIARTARKQDAPAVVLDAAILLEARWHDLCDVLVFVDAPDEARLERVKAHRGWSAEALEDREKAQRPLPEKRKRADFVVEIRATPRPSPRPSLRSGTNSPAAPPPPPEGGRRSDGASASKDRDEDTPPS
jgi:dephospho-CoA kinase